MQPYLAFHLDPHCLKIVISFIDTAINFMSDWLHLLFFPLVICDVEAHTMFMIFRGEGSKEEDPFREWFSKLGELRSLCPKAQMVALTATAGPTQRRKIVRSLCFGANSKVIHDSPDRSNIKISSKCIPNNEVPDKTFKWLFSELHTCAENLQRHVIFCQSISDVSKVYMSFVREFGQDSALFDMYHSKTNEKVKEKIRDDMSSNGVIRVLICTNAAGMGVNFFGLNNVIHYGLPYQMDTFVQQMGRAGRDGEFSQELIIFKSHKGQLSKVESDLIKLVKDSETCRREILCSAYLTKKSEIIPLHNCCDVCDITCDCKSDICPNKHKAFLEPQENESEDEMERPVSDAEKALLRHKLLSYKYSLTEQAGFSIIDVDVIQGLTDNVIDSIVSKSSKLFTSNDIMTYFPIWSYETAEQVFHVICDVFGDTEMYNLSGDESDSS